MIEATQSELDWDGSTRQFFHVAGTSYEAGDDLLSWDLHEQRYGSEPGEWKWDDMLDTDIVCLFATLSEAEEFAAEYGGSIIAVNVPTYVSMALNGEGYPYIPRMIEADWIACA